MDASLTVTEQVDYLEFIEYPKHFLHFLRQSGTFCLSLLLPWNEDKPVKDSNHGSYKYP
jgi:hypothetical protein